MKYAASKVEGGKNRWSARHQYGINWIYGSLLRTPGANLETMSYGPLSEIKPDERLSREEIWIYDRRQAGRWEGGFISFFLCLEWFGGHHGHLGEIGALIHDICIYIHRSDFSISWQGLFPTARLRDLRLRLPLRGARRQTYDRRFSRSGAAETEISPVTSHFFPRLARKTAGGHFFFFVTFNWFRTVESKALGPWKWAPSTAVQNTELFN